MKIKQKIYPLLIKLYKHYDEKEKLYNHFISEFYNILKLGKSRDIYNKASKYINAISKLNNGNEFVEEILIDLKNSDYQKCSALFDEINKSLKN